MSFWIALWELVFVVTIAVFLLMAVLVSWFGAGDIRRLLQRLQDDDETTEQLPPGD
jgi:hypothetical protein